MLYTFIFTLSLVVVVVQGYGIGTVPKVVLNTVAQPSHSTTVTITTTTTRRNVLNVATKQVAAIIATSGTFMTIATLAREPAIADVSDGNALPQGAQQFARTIKLKTDLKV
jgi:hypothetical protein